MSTPYKLSYLVPHIGGQTGVTGWRMRCGMVLHRQLLWTGFCDTRWVVGDPMSGASVVTGDSMGDAVRRYRRLVALCGDQWPQKLEGARKRNRSRVLAMSRRFDQTEWSHYQHHQSPYLGAEHRSH